MIRYPVAGKGASPFLDCPVHGCLVVLGNDGRIKTRCPECLSEQRRARTRWSRRRHRAKLRAL